MTDPTDGCPSCGVINGNHAPDCNYALVRDYLRGKSPAAEPAEQTEPRRCLWILETEYDPKGGYIPVMVTENEPGYNAMRGQGGHAQPWFWGHDLDTAKRLADKANDERGISRGDALEIVASSMAAQNAQEDSR